MLLAAVAVLCVPVLAEGACPVGFTPETYLSNVSLGLRLNVVGPAPPNQRSSAIGTFLPLPGGTGLARLTRIDNGGRIRRQVPAPGQWAINSDCTAGILSLSLDSNSYTIRFDVSANGDLSVSAGEPAAGRPAVDERGNPVLVTFTRNPPMVCPRGPEFSPLNAFAGTTYAFSATNDLIPPTAAPGIPQGFRPPTDTGLLIGTIPYPAAFAGSLIVRNRIISSSPQMVQVYNPPGSLHPIDPNHVFYMPREDSYGHYLIYDDCSGGELILTDPAFPRHYEFLFTPDFAGLWFVSLTPGFPYSGTATKQ